MIDPEKFISGAAGADWSWFENQPDEIRRNLELERARTAEDARAVASAWADFYATPGGKKALDLLFASTLWRTVYWVQLGLDIQSMAVFGAFREGQNALAHEIARQIAAGRGEEQPKPRDVS